MKVQPKPTTSARPTGTSQSSKKSSPPSRSSSPPRDSARVSTEARSRPSEAPKGLQALTNNFNYRPAQLQDHSGANFWKPGSSSESGTQANRQINQDYAGLSQAADQYMRAGTGAPTLNNFFEFAEQASTAVGEQIRNIENVQQAAGGSAEAAVKAGGSMLNGTSLDQVRRVHGATMSDQADQVVRQNPQSNSLVNGSRVAGGTVGQMWGEMETTRGALVNGNTGIHKELGSAANTFFQGESQGGKGLESLRAAGVYPGSDKDPDGLVTRAFTSMQRVRDLSQQWEKAATPEQKQAIEAQRMAAAKDSTFSFMMQEQGHILQNGAIFDDPTMKRNLRAITPTMSFQDTNGQHGQLGQGQDYSNFKQRLGLNEVPANTPGAYPLTREGNTRYFQPDPSQKGSIVDYFSSNMESARARPMIDAPARDLEAPPASQTGRGVLQLAQGLDSRDFSTMTAGGIRGAGGAVADTTRWAGNQLDEAGSSLASQGVRQAQQGGYYNSAVGNVKAVGGVALHKTGQVAEAAGRMGSAAVDWTADAADASINWTANTAKGAARRAKRALESLLDW